ncbi:hypothetical protein PV325_007181 [Microctonus aethiopoides]|nr:hypothetical protein PV325_007181 [Microctonus aethiopoides]
MPTGLGEIAGEVDREDMDLDNSRMETPETYIVHAENYISREVEFRVIELHPTLLNVTLYTTKDAAIETG